MSINPNRYPVDYTGSATTNLIENESVTLTTNEIRVFAPTAAPFFKSSMVIKDADTGLTLTNSQWTAYFLVSAPSAITDIGDEVYSIVAITDESVSNNLTITYQTVGGDYVCSFDNIISMITPLLSDSRPVTWPNIIDRLSGFTPNQHLHPINQTLGWEYLVTFVEILKNVILVGDLQQKDAVLAYIDSALASSAAVVEASLSSTSTFGKHVADTSNPHEVSPEDIGLGLVENYGLASNAEAYAGTSSELYVTADQVKMVVQDAVDLGMDAHIARTDNPHGLTPAQLDLDLLMNYAVATSAELASPDAASPKYVTNVILAAYLTSYFSTQQANITSAIADVTTQLATLTTQANAAKATAEAAAITAAAATSSAAAAATTGTAALAQANANALSATASAAAIQTLFEQYVTTAVANAYAQGFAAGKAA